MKATRLSYAYLIGYLVFGGAGMLIAPDFSFRLLGATGSYPPSLVRLLGAFLLALSVIVVQIARLKLEVLYPTTVLVRLPIVATTLGLYVVTRDPVFLSLAAIVGVGMILTVGGLLADRRARLHTGLETGSYRNRHASSETG